MKKTMIAVPCTDMINAVSVECLDELQHRTGIKAERIVGQPTAIARNMLSRRALATESEYVLWLDSDMVFGPDILDRMFESIGDKEFLTAVYNSRHYPFGPILFDKVEYIEGEKGEIIPEAEKIELYPQHSIFEVAGAGFGCVLIKTSLLKAVMQTYGEPFRQLAGFEEDLSFCYRARQLGHKLYCDSNIEVGHIAHINITPEWYKVSKNEVTNGADR